MSAGDDDHGTATRSAGAAAADEQRALTALQDDSGPVGSSWPYGSDPDQIAELFGPDDGPLVVVVHGGYFRPGTDRSHARPQARALAEAGYRVVLAEYRRVPGSPQDTVEDLRLLDAALPRPAAAWVGHSAGGALVLLRALAVDLAPVSVLALAPVADLQVAYAQRLGSDAVRDWIGGSPTERPDAYARLDPRALLEAGRAPSEPVAVVHGEADVAVPVALSRGLPPHPAITVRLLPGRHHLDLIDPASAAWPTVLDTLRALTGR
ncbi:putative lipase/esterase [Tersicoccus solisilvae]|uniref:Lipase/esterase n=1 Tax=Tersicoccus solisilvae TaxID=1882339 RepID=A0ABQ1P476_9MICC|nr:alpha/beta hydrolase [Tersicoccus solisilvae]GGC90665.1 putative lipase/esterase [Tersicoccus solisilvae]